MNTPMIRIEEISTEVKKNLENKEIAGALLATTFKGLDVQKMAMALREGMIAGFTFEDFMKKDVYAIPYSNGYSLVTSIDFTRKIAMKNGLCGKSEPIYTYKDESKKEIESCTVTVKRNVNGMVGEYTAKVFFGEYSTGKNLWGTKPHTMIAKVAEMHALRMAFPEDLAKQYAEEEFQKPEIVPITIEMSNEERAKATTSLEESTTKEELVDAWASLTQKQREDSAIKEAYTKLSDKYQKAETATAEPSVQLDEETTAETETKPSSIKKRTAKKDIKVEEGEASPEDLPDDLK